MTILGPLPESWVCEDCNAVFSIDAHPSSPLEERCPRCQEKLHKIDAELHAFCGIRPDESEGAAAVREFTERYWDGARAAVSDLAPLIERLRST